MLSTINQLTAKFEQKNAFRANLLYLNSAQLELLKVQLSEHDIEIISQLIGMDIVLLKGNSKAYVSWAAIPWKHSKLA